MDASDQILDANAATTTSRPPATTPTGGSPTTPRASARCSASCARRWAAEPPRFERALEIGAGTGYFIINLVRAGVVSEAVATDISPGMLDVLSTTAAELGVAGGDRGLRGIGAALRGRLVRPRGRPRRAPPPSGPRRRLPRVPARAAPRRRRGLLRRALLLRGQVGRAAEARRTRRRAAVAGADGRRAAPNGHNGTDREEDRLEQVVDVHASPARRRPRCTPAGPGLARGAGERRGAGRQPLRLGQPRPRGHRRARRDPLRLALYAYRGYLLLQALDRSLLEPRLPAAMFYNLLISGRAPAWPLTPPAPGRAPRPAPPAPMNSRARRIRGAPPRRGCPHPAGLLTTHASTASRNGTGWCGTSRSEAASVRAAAARPALRSRASRAPAPPPAWPARASACRASACPRPAGPQSRPPRAAMWPPARAGWRAAPA